MCPVRSVTYLSGRSRSTRPEVAEHLEHDENDPSGNQRYDTPIENGIRLSTPFPPQQAKNFMAGSVRSQLPGPQSAARNVCSNQNGFPLVVEHAVPDRNH